MQPTCITSTGFCIHPTTNIQKQSIGFNQNIIVAQIYNRLLIRDYPGRPVPEEAFTHSHPSWSSDILFNFPHLLRSIAFSLFSLHARLSSLTTSLQVLFGHPLHPILTFLQHMPIPTQPILLQYQCYIIYT